MFSIWFVLSPDDWAALVTHNFTVICGPWPILSIITHDFVISLRLDGSDITRELIEIRGQQVKDIRFGMNSDEEYMVILTAGKLTSYLISAARSSYGDDIDSQNCAVEYSTIMNIIGEEENSNYVQTMNS